MFDDRIHTRMNSSRMKSGHDFGRSRRNRSASPPVALDFTESDTPEWDVTEKFGGTGLKRGSIGGLFEEELKILIQRMVRDLVSSKIHILENMANDNGERLNHFVSEMNDLKRKAKQADCESRRIEEFSERLDRFESDLKEMPDLVSSRIQVLEKLVTNHGERLDDLGSKVKQAESAGAERFNDLKKQVDAIRDSRMRKASCSPSPGNIIEPCSRFLTPETTSATQAVERQGARIIPQFSSLELAPKSLELAPKSSREVVRSASATTLVPEASVRTGTNRFRPEASIRSGTTSVPTLGVCQNPARGVRSGLQMSSTNDSPRRASSPRRSQSATASTPTRQGSTSNGIQQRGSVTIGGTQKLSANTQLDFTQQLGATSPATRMLQSPQVTSPGQMQSPTQQLAFASQPSRYGSSGAFTPGVSRLP